MTPIELTLHWMLIISVMVSIVHAFEEFIGRIWFQLGDATHNFWAMTRTPLQGLATFILMPCIAQVAIAHQAYGGDGSIGWMALLFGLRIGDVIFIHGAPCFYYRSPIGIPFSGHATSLALATEAVLIICLFGDRMLTCNGAYAVFGFLVYAMVQPVLALTADQERKKYTNER